MIVPKISTEILNKVWCNVYFTFRHMEHLGVHIKFVQNNKITNTEEGTGVLQLI